MNGRWRERLLGLPGLLAAGAWGFAEGCFFFVVPDVLLCLTALFSLRRALAQMAAVVAGALMAGGLLFAWAAHDSVTARSAVMAVPFVRPEMTTQVERDLDAHGAVGLLLGPFNGIPYKLYAVEAPGRTGIIPFLAASVPARIERLAGGILLFSALGWFLRRRRLDDVRWGVSIHAAYWIIIYVFYWGLG
jgi:hypothetical protein